jgi:hypothetical protein
LVFAGVPPSAEAHARAGLWRWLDGLSGPDDFTGLVFDVSLLCYGTPVVGGDDVDRLRVDPGCLSTDPKRLKPTIGVKFAYLWGHNTLDYGPASAPDVSALALMGTIDVPVDKKGVLEAGVGLGGVRFSADPAAFWRPAIEPRLTVKPLVFKGRGDQRRKWEWLQIQFSRLGILGRIDAEDFGARNYSASGELIPSVTVFVDVLSLGKLLR